MGKNRNCQQSCLTVLAFLSSGGAACAFVRTRALAGNVTICAV
ncbi:hypothetical protein NEILACOT_03081 [Neisseria lactamica ATCC 23970]|uniref:Lipoprotein n=1 Tax=Neisseria lactamica ATCC 23970 TaxID=546265 RepID=D0W6E3_NEILA|nr:hypothetical protein NEILACOT_03081 [Neisseria lactamica ATCC 23970]